MRYLTVRECTRRLRAAGMPINEREVAGWAVAEAGRDIWRVGRHVYIYEGEVSSLMRACGEATH